MNASLIRVIYLTVICSYSFSIIGAQNNDFVIANELSQKFLFSHKQTETLYWIGEFKELYVDTISLEIIIPNALLITELYCLLDFLGKSLDSELCDKIYGPFNIYNIYNFHSKAIIIAAYVGKLEFDKVNSQEVDIPDLGFGLDQFQSFYSKPVTHKYILYLSLHLSVESYISSHGPVTTIINIYKLTDDYDLSELLKWGHSYVENLEVYTHDQSGLIRVK